ncbi:MAG: hypothetical protein IKL03_00440 [Bacteroidaceae bacterium]|nr:hypothetical protein [Bacteroidaceae bacterium]
MWLYVISLSCFVTLIVSFIGARSEMKSSKSIRDYDKEEPTLGLKLVATIISLIVGGFVSWLFYWLLS